LTSPNLGGLDKFATEPEKVVKPWGHELIWAVADHYVGKILVVKAGESLSLQFHKLKDEAWYVLEGDLRFRLDSDIASAPAGSFVFVPRGTPHCFQNVGSAPARILVLFTPSGMERFFDRFAKLPAFDPGAFAGIGREVGMDVVGALGEQGDEEDRERGQDRSRDPHARSRR